MTQDHEPSTPKRIASQLGEGSAMQQLIAEHLPWMEARVRQRLSPAVRMEGDTQDFVQEVLLEVLRDGAKLVADNPAAFRGLLARMLENTLIDRHRYMHRERRDRRKQCALPSGSADLRDGPLMSITTPSSHAMLSEQQAWLRLALELLDPDDREAIRLRDWEELSFPEAGQRLGISEDAVRKRYGRALPKLAKKLEMLRRGTWQNALDSSDS